MTEGIIQRVIQEYINMDINSRKKGFDGMTNTQDMLKELEKELIEEVNKLKWHYCTNPQCPHAYSVEVKKLIGDNP